jgi:hypothetical protein
MVNKPWSVLVPPRHIPRCRICLRRRKLVALGLVVAIAVATTVSLIARLTLDTPIGFETDSVVLYQPKEIMQARVAAVAEFANYIKQLQTVCAEFFATSKTPETLHVVVAVRPGKRGRVWLISSIRPAPDTHREQLRKKLEAIPPCEVRDGPVAFAISARLAGGAGKNPKGDKVFQPPIPKEWQDAVKGKEGVLLPDGFLDLVWPDKK